MLNQVVLMGRLTADPDINYIQGTDSLVIRFCIAVERDYKAANEEKPKTDFIYCTAWNKTGKFIQTYFKKGNMIAVTGTIETGSYTNKDGNKVYTTEVRVTKASFTGERAASKDNMPEPTPPNAGDGFMNIPEGVDEHLPFD